MGSRYANQYGGVQLHKSSGAGDEKNGYGKIVNVASGLFSKIAQCFCIMSVRRAPKSHLLVHLRAGSGRRWHHRKLYSPRSCHEREGYWRSPVGCIKDGNTATRAIKREQMPEDLIGTLVFFSSSDRTSLLANLVVDGGSAIALTAANFHRMNGSCPRRSKARRSRIMRDKWYIGTPLARASIATLTSGVAVPNDLLHLFMVHYSAFGISMAGRLRSGSDGRVSNAKRLDYHP